MPIQWFTVGSAQWYALWAVTALYLQPTYIKGAGKWAFVAPEKEFLTDVPADPVSQFRAWSLV